MAFDRYEDIDESRNENGKRVLQTSTPPRYDLSRDDIYIYTRVGDRLDLLAQRYYGDPTKWVIIAAANHLPSLVIKEPQQLRIPQESSNEYETEYIKQNTDR